jgi:hypothetical protein
VAQLAGRLEGFQTACAAALGLQSDASAAHRVLQRALAAIDGASLMQSREASRLPTSDTPTAQAAPVPGIDTLVPSRAAMAQARRKQSHTVDCKREKNGCGTVQRVGQTRCKSNPVDQTVD